MIYGIDANDSAGTIEVISLNVDIYNYTGSTSKNAIYLNDINFFRSEMRIGNENGTFLLWSRTKENDARSNNLEIVDSTFSASNTNGQVITLENIANADRIIIQNDTFSNGIDGNIIKSTHGISDSQASIIIDNITFDGFGYSNNSLIKFISTEEDCSTILNSSDYSYEPLVTLSNLTMTNCENTQLMNLECVSFNLFDCIVDSNIFEYSRPMIEITSNSYANNLNPFLQTISDHNKNVIRLTANETASTIIYNTRIENSNSTNGSLEIEGTFDDLQFKNIIKLLNYC